MFLEGVPNFVQFSIFLPGFDHFFSRPRKEVQRKQQQIFWSKTKIFAPIIDCVKIESIDSQRGILQMKLSEKVTNFVHLL